jgi:hypothetical protein
MPSSCLRKWVDLFQVHFSCRMEWCFSLVFVALLIPAAFASTEALTIPPAGTATWDELLRREQLKSNWAAETREVMPRMPAPKGREIGRAGFAPNQFFESAPRSPFKERVSPVKGIVPLGPAAGGSFQALGDNNTRIPPDTNGAAGPNHVMTMLNSQVRIQDKAGTISSTVTLRDFWTSGTGLTGTPFDPKLLYDSISGRWIATCDVNSRSTISKVFFAISLTSDPTGSWTYYSFVGDASGTTWVDYPGFGYNSTWIAITNNMFPVPTGDFVGSKMWVIDKSTALAGGALTVTVFPALFDTAGGSNGFSLRPCETFDSAEPKLYLVDNSDYTDSGTHVHLLRLSEITGTGPSSSWAVTAGSAYAGTGLFQVTHDFNSNQIEGSQMGTATAFDTGDLRMANAVVRNGKVWCAHSAGLPVSATSDRTGVAWYQLNPLLMPSPIVQSGLLDGGAGVHYCFPSINANANDDACLGFSRSDSSRFIEAVVTGRLGTDPAGSMDPISVIKAGEDSYVKTFGAGGVRWGDYSSTVVDPSDDLNFWTIQEYAALDVGPGPSDDRWGTWWAQRVAPGGSTPLPSLTVTNTRTTTNTRTPTDTQTVTLTPTETPTDSSTPTSTVTQTPVDTATFSPTATLLPTATDIITATETPTPTPTGIVPDFDVFPLGGDGKIDALDLLELFHQGREDSGTLFDFSRFWHH